MQGRKHSENIRLVRELRRVGLWPDEQEMVAERVVALGRDPLVDRDLLCDGAVGDGHVDVPGFQVVD